MARHGKGGRPKGRYLKGNIDMNVELGTLAGNTALTTVMPDTVTERSLVSSFIASFILSGFTLLDNVGPVMVGVAHGDYTLAEIEEWIELQTGWAEADKISQERAKRLVKRIGVFEMVGGLTGVSRGTLNEGRPVRIRLGWILNAGQTLQIWAYNMGSAAFGSTDPNLHVQGHANLWAQ